MATIQSLTIKHLITLVILILAIIFMASFSNSSNRFKAKMAESKEVSTPRHSQHKFKTYYVDLKNSYVNFMGSKPTGRHQGQFKLSEGFVQVKKNEIIGGTFTIDIASLAITDAKDALDEESKGKLAGHLLSMDFFDAERFGTAKFEIIAVETYEAPTDVEELNQEETELESTNPTHYVIGNLEMIGITKSIKFPASISIDKKQLIAKATFNINRVDWGMRYGADESLGDKYIRPTCSHCFTYRG